MGCQHFASLDLGFPNADEKMTMMTNHMLMITDCTWWMNFILVVFLS